MIKDDMILYSLKCLLNIKRFDMEYAEIISKMFKLKIIEKKLLLPIASDEASSEKYIMITNESYIPLKQEIINNYENLYDSEKIDKSFVREYNNIHDYISVIILNSFIVNGSIVNPFFLNMNKELGEGMFLSNNKFYYDLKRENLLFGTNEIDVNKRLKNFFDMMYISNIAVKQNKLLGGHVLFMLNDAFKKVSYNNFQHKSKSLEVKATLMFGESFGSVLNAVSQAQNNYIPFDKYPGLFDIFFNINIDKKGIFNYILSDDFLSRIYDVQDNYLSTSYKVRNIGIFYAVFRLVQRLVEDDVYNTFVLPDHSNFKCLDSYIDILNQISEVIEDEPRLEIVATVDKLINNVVNGVIELEDDFRK